ncbi:CLUMA_CG015621, isoform A [Clunio marinus]|uniref:CLUMA_CG015621, isoform A n=1 Tax=Clunio marinus TaxID=568069 RepID=A0A1J1IQB4_9DIPT|nr:CLUMA_CG015621, isoform A [Clunio marinus]
MWQGKRLFHSLTAFTGWGVYRFVIAQCEIQASLLGVKMVIWLSKPPPTLTFTRTFTIDFYNTQKQKQEIYGAVEKFFMSIPPGKNLLCSLLAFGHRHEKFSFNSICKWIFGTFDVTG